jgi:hypothetical protein
VKKVAAFIVVILFYVFVAFGFTWAENSGAIDKVIYVLGIDNSSVVQGESIESNGGVIASNMPVPPPPYPEPNQPPDVRMASNMPVPPPPYPEPNQPPDVRMASNMPVPPPPYPEPNQPPNFA